MTQVLIIGSVWPEPASSAAGSRMIQLIELFLGQHWSVTFASAALPSSHMADLEAIGVDKVGIELNSSTFDSFVAQLQPDLVIFDRFMTEEQFGWRVAAHCPDALRLLDTEDLHCLRVARQQAVKENREVNSRDLNSELAMREIAAILRCDLALIISRYEMTLLQEHYRVDGRLLWYLPFMLSPVSIADWPDYSVRDGYVCIGNFRHPPNWDAVLYLKETLWPLIRARQPKAKLSVYGAYPPKKATQLHNPKQGFLVEGWADNARTVMREARVCLAPLRFGAGLKGKLIDAMSCGTPSATTTVGAEAMHGELPWGGIVADDPEDFADGAVTLYRAESAWLQAQLRGMDIINSHYDKVALGRDLLKKVALLVYDLERHRLNNFAGAMLQHHTLQSTRYMAQWIEEKNRHRDLKS